MLKHLFFGLFVVIVTALLGIDIIYTEPSILRWIGLLAILGSAIVAMRTWISLSIQAEELTGFKPKWHIEKVLVGSIAK